MCRSVNYGREVFYLFTAAFCLDHMIENIHSSQSRVNQRREASLWRTVEERERRADPCRFNQTQFFVPLARES